MKLKQKKIFMTILLLSSIANVGANSVCNTLPGGLNCGQGTVNQVYGNGIVNIDGTTVTASTMVNGTLTAQNASFFSLDVNGTADFINSSISEPSSIKGALSASSTIFNNGLNVYSNETKLTKSKIVGDLHLPKITEKKQIVYLDDASEITGDIIFDAGHGIVFFRGKSKINGHVIGGKSCFK
ncbi:MAG: hypothetical protein P1U39_07475 [Legionellaceae bacterium]|nr:hypothetical protein [Legionellaceae bacterium]